MLYYEGLEEIIFHRHEIIDCNELFVLSGYVGPNPISRCRELPFKTTVVYGMYGSEGIRRGLHTQLIKESLENRNLQILYSTIPVHSKLYCWMKDGKVVHALIGSANFSVSGLTAPYKETLAETTRDTFSVLDKYLKEVQRNSIVCADAVVKENRKRHSSEETADDKDQDICSLKLYSTKGKIEVQAKHGLNWCLSEANVSEGDACIAIPVECLRKYPQLFPEKLSTPSDQGQIQKRGHRHNDNIEIIWDDGTRMQGLLEGTQYRTEDGVKKPYPKQIASTPKKSILGKYLRKRLGVDLKHRITLEDLDRYGRRTVDVSLQGEGIYYFDFSVDEKTEEKRSLRLESYNNAISKENKC